MHLLDFRYTRPHLLLIMFSLLISIGLFLLHHQRHHRPRPRRLRCRYCNWKQKRTNERCKMQIGGIIKNISWEFRRKFVPFRPLLRNASRNVKIKFKSIVIKFQKLNGMKPNGTQWNESSNTFTLTCNGLNQT